MVKTADAVVNGAGGSVPGYNVLTLSPCVSGLSIYGKGVEVWAAVCIGVKLTAYIAAMAIITTRSELARVAQHLIVATLSNS